MVRRNKGHVINIGSLAGDGAYAGGSVYCATKAAVKILSDGLRIDVADTKIRVTDVKPGLVETNFSNVRFHGDKAKLVMFIKALLLCLEMILPMLYSMQQTSLNMYK